VRREFFEPFVVVLKQAIFGIIDINARGDVHRIHEAEAFLDAALGHQLFHRASNIQIIAPMRRFEPEMFRQGFHSSAMPSKGEGRNSQIFVFVFDGMRLFQRVFFKAMVSAFLNRKTA
jgi:hypothetical protein